MNQYPKHLFPNRPRPVRLTAWLLALMLALGLAVPAAGESAFTLEENERISGMDCTWYQGYAPAISYNTMTLCLPIRASQVEGSITASIALEDPQVLLLASEPKAVTVQPRDGLYPVKLSLQLSAKRRNGDYPAVITLRGLDARGQELIQTIPYVIRIRDGAPSHEALQPQIRDVAGDLNVGSDGSLTLTIANPTTSISMTDAVLTVTDLAGEVLMSGSDLFAIGEVLPGKSQTVTIPVAIRANAAISQHTIEVSLTYKALGRETRWTERFTIAVTQDIRLEHGAPELPTAIAGDLATLTLPLMNLGRGELRNVLVKLELEGAAREQSVLVGNLAPGESKQAKLTFTPELSALGSYAGTVTLTCEDAYGNPFRRSMDVDLQVQAPAVQQPQTQQQTRKVPVVSIVLGVLCGALCLGLVLQGKLLGDRLRKMEEDRL